MPFIVSKISVYPKTVDCLKLCASAVSIALFSAENTYGQRVDFRVIPHLWYDTLHSPKNYARILLYDKFTTVSSRKTLRTFPDLRAFRINVVHVSFYDLIGSMDYKKSNVSSNNMICNKKM
jgi:hypothetical protein